MQARIKKRINEVSLLIKEAKECKNEKEKTLKRLEELDNNFRLRKIDESGYKKGLKEVLKGKKKEELIKESNERINRVLERINNSVDFVELFSEGRESFLDKLSRLSFEKKKEEGVFDEKGVRAFARSLKKKESKIRRVNYSVYKTNLYNVLANKLFSEFTKKLIRKYPKYFKSLEKNLRLSNLSVFSSTYVDMAFLSSVLAVFLGFVLAVMVFFKGFSVFSFVKSFFLTLAVGAITLIVFYYYPYITIDSRRREIKNELPFAIIHMAAVAGSGAQVSTLFSVLLQSGEYKALNGEIKKIMNYVNLFGYGVGGALKKVAESSPSPDFKLFLSGMVETIETGGDLKVYLKNKADDTMSGYRAERRRYVEALSTYSDIYTAILIAAPLLFIVVLVLLSLVGSKIGSLDIGFVEKLGTFVIVPVLNIAFMMFLNIVQPEM